MVSTVPAGQYERYVFKDFPHSSHRTLLALAGIGPGRVLDVGAASGYLGRALATAGYTVVGIDRETPAVPAAWYDAFHVVDLAQLPALAEAPFDVIVAGDVLEHLSEPDRALAALAGLLARGGRILISVPNVAFALVRFQLLAGRFEYAERGIMDVGHLRFFTRRSLLRLVRAAGLTPGRPIGLPPPLPLVSPLFLRWPLRVVHDLAAVAARVWPTLFAYQLVLEARR